MCVFLHGDLEQHHKYFRSFQPRWLMWLTLTRVLHCTPRTAGKPWSPNYSTLHRLQVISSLMDPRSCLIKGCCKTQASVCPPLIRGQIYLLCAYSRTSSQLCVGHKQIIRQIIIIISGSFCANTEFHWDPFYLAENKQKKFFLHNTWVFSPQA